MGGDQGAKARFRAAVGIAGPMDLEQCAADISSPQWKKRAISFTICHGVKHHLFSKLVVSPFSHLVDRDRVRRIHLMRGLDEIVSELHGYRDVDDYYARNSPRPRLANISVPTLLLNSADDPVVSFKCFPSGRLNETTTSMLLSRDVEATLAMVAEGWALTRGLTPWQHVSCR